MGLVDDRGLSEQVGDLLIEWIMSSRFEPGERVRESRVAEELGVSRTPVREALKRLAERGFVRTIPRRGVFVTEIDGRRLEEILELRYLFEMHAAETGVGRISDEELAEMHSLIDELESLVGSLDDYVRYLGQDCRFHRLIIRACGNRLLNELYDRQMAFLQIAKIRLSRPQSANMQRGCREHKSIVEAYEAGDRDRLLQVLGVHLNRTRCEVLELE